MVSIVDRAANDDSSLLNINILVLNSSLDVCCFNFVTLLRINTRPVFHMGCVVPSESVLELAQKMMFFGKSAKEGWGGGVIFDPQIFIANGIFWS